MRGSLRVLLAGFLGVGVAIASADTLVKVNGESYTGEITQTENGYSVKMKAGTIVVPAEDVDHIVKGTTPRSVGSVAGSSGTPTPLPRSGASAPGARAPAKPVDPKMLQALLDQGQAALSSGEYKSACDSFKDALTLDRNNAIALHGLGAALMYLHDFNRAKEPMERALTVAPPNRALVLNMAVMQIAVHNPMRAAKIVKEYLAAHAGQPDEPMLNAMAIALSMTDGQARKGRLFPDLVKFYMAGNSQLEAAATGQKRWGVEWMEANVVDAKMAAMNKAQQHADKIGNDLDAADGRVADAQNNLDALQAAMRRNPFAINQAQSDLDRAGAARDKLAEQYDSALAAVPRPSFPKSLSLVGLSDQTPPPVHGVTLAFGTENGAGGDTFTPSQPTDMPPVAPRLRSRSGKQSSGGGGQGMGQGSSGQTAAPPAIDIVQARPAEAHKVQLTSYAVAFPVAKDLVVTAAATLAGATEIQLQASDGSALSGQVVRTDEATGLALLRVSGRALAPLDVADAFAGGPLQCAGFPTVNIFNPSAEIFGGTAPPSKEGWKVRLDQHPRLPGGPLLAGGKVVGVELAARESDASAIPSATSDQLRKFLGDDGSRQPATNPDPAGSLLQVLATRESQ